MVYTDKSKEEEASPEELELEVGDILPSKRSHDQSKLEQHNHQHIADANIFETDW